MTIVFKVSDNIKPLMMEFYKDRMLDKKPPYSVFQVKEYDCVITLYESGKVMFQGIGADIEASYWIEEERIKNGRMINIDGTEKKNTPEKRILFNESTIGSDEVGTGDFFGPIVVTATYVSKEDISLLAKAEAMRHTIDVRLQHDGIELPKTDRMTYHDAAQVFGLTSAETEEFSAALQQDVVSEVDESEISDVIDQIESNFGKTEPSDTVIPISKEIMIDDSIFDEEADFSPDFGNDFSQSEFDLDEF